MFRKIKVIIYNNIIDNLHLNPYEFQLLNILINQKGVISLSEITKKVTFSKAKILRTLTDLEKDGYIKTSKKISDYEAFNILKNGKELHKKGCLFCGYNKCFLDEHHYPIRAKDNGSETISICSNCHREFHYITDYSKNYIPLMENILSSDKADRGVK